MAHFYGSVQGGRGKTTRTGTRISGLTTKAASWEGAVETKLYERDGADWARIQLVPHFGNGTFRTLYDGPVSGMEVK